MTILFPSYCGKTELWYGKGHSVLKILSLLPHTTRPLLFVQGRDFESVYVNHRYTEQERETLSSFESLDYLPSHSMVYKQWIRQQPARWVDAMGLSPDT